MINKKDISLGILAPGSGYSSDMQQLASQQCYNVVNVTAQAPSSSLSLSTSTRFSDLESDLSISVSAKGGYGMFSGSASASYLRDIEDKDYSLSLNYYEIVSSEVGMQFPGPGLKMLSSSGENYYKNGTSQYFGILCGDYVVTSYQAGAMLLMSINLEFSSNYEKQKFEASAGASFGNIFSASSNIQKVATSLNLNGAVSMQAFQIGGQPEQLSKILNASSSGEYYVLTCSLKAMDNCVKAASALLGYASNDFDTQLSFSPDKNIYPLTNKYDIVPIEEFGLISPKSFVNSTVIEARDNLSDAYIENQYYQQKLHELQNGYPVKFDSQFQANLTDFSNMVSNNLNALTSTSDPMASSVSCFNIPQNCIEISQNVLANVKNVTSETLNFLDSIEYFWSYQIDITCGQGGVIEFYNIGGFSNWDFVNSNTQDYISKIYEFTLDQGANATFNVMSIGAGDSNQIILTHPVVQTNGNIVFQEGTNSGAVCVKTSPSSPFVKNVSPFYFSLYQPSDDAMPAGELLDSANQEGFAA